MILRSIVYLKYADKTKPLQLQGLCFVGSRQAEPTAPSGRYSEAEAQ